LDHYDTFDRRVQLGASRHRCKDAEFLQQSARWNGAIYLGGYVIECSLKALICYGEQKNSLKDTAMYKQGKISGADLHNLWLLYAATPLSFRKAFELDRTHTLKNAWTILNKIWQKDQLRYGHKLGDKVECEKFFEAVNILHAFILSYQGESP
jgi:hypothetical protein